MKRYLWIFGSVLFLLAKIECYGEEKQIKESELYATAAVLMDGNSGRVLYEKNGQEFMANASTTKIMTCILALENAELEDIVTVSAYAASMPDVQLHIREGEEYQLKDLLLSLMLESHNDVAVAIAEHIGGSCEGFAVLMNRKAKEIGCKNTLFITPNGLDAAINNEEKKMHKFHGTTAEDLALIMRYCIQESPMKEKFVEITSTTSHSFSDLKNKRSFSCNNHNSLFNMMEGVVSGKTGFTSKAGYCCVGAVKQEGEMYIVALLACGWPGNKNYKWKDCKTLIEYGVEKYELVNLEEIKDKYRKEMTVLIKNAKKEKIEEEIWVDLEWKKREQDMVLVQAGENITVKVQKENIEAPIKRGQKIGECQIFINEKLWRIEGLYSMKEVEKKDISSCIKMILHKIV